MTLSLSTKKVSRIVFLDIFKVLDSFISPDEVEKDQAKQKVEELIMRGKRKEAVEEAIAFGDFATALLVATMCDTETYRRATISFAQNAFSSDSPMTTVAMLFSGALQVPDSGEIPADLWGVSAAELKASWKRHLAGIISNRISGWDSIVLSLGDRLRSYGEIAGAHFCYMVCGCPVASPLKDGTRICLLGSNHVMLSERALLSSNAIEAFDRTEAYEWAKRQGNKNASLTSFQPFKIIFVSHLIDAGYTDRAKSYVTSMRMYSNFSETKTGDRSLTNLSNIFENGPSQIYTLRNLTKTLGITTDTQSSKSYIKDAEAKDENKATIKTMSPIDVQTIIPALEVAHSRSPLELDITFNSARSNLMDITGYTVDSPKKSTDAPLDSHLSDHGHHAQSPTLAEAKVLPQVSKADGVGQGLQLDATPQSKSATRKPLAVATTTPQTNGKPKPAPSTAPSILIGGKTTDQNRTSAPSSLEKRKFQCRT